jgi:hypothetical protein
MKLGPYGYRHLLARTLAIVAIVNAVMLIRMWYFYLTWQIILGITVTELLAMFLNVQFWWSHREKSPDGHLPLSW